MGLSHACSFETPRLTALEWHSPRLGPAVDLPTIVAELLTPDVTATLPAQWRGAYPPERAQAWITDRDQESTVLLVTERSTGEPVGLLILHEIAAAGSADDVDLRIGYIVAQAQWGRGLAREMVGGLLSWCAIQPPIRSIAGGVAAENVASRRVLLGNGFVPTGDPHAGEQLYQLVLNR